MTAAWSPSGRRDLAKSSKQTAGEPPIASGGEAPRPEAPMPTGSGILGSRPRPDGGSPSGGDLEAAERRRFERTIKEKT
jgi:hypothetical protein